MAAALTGKKGHQAIDTAFSLYSEGRDLDPEGEVLIKRIATLRRYCAQSRKNKENAKEIIEKLKQQRHKCIGEEAEELFETNWDLEVDNFDDMGLKEEVLRGIYAFGFKEPSPIQQKGILPII